MRTRQWRPRQRCFVTSVATGAWDEALVRYKSGEGLYISNKEALGVLAGVHQERELQSPTFYTIKEWLQHQGDIVSINEIMSDCLQVNVANKMPRDLLSVSTTIGIIMRKLRWRKGTNDDSNKYFAPSEQEDMWDEG